MTEPQDPPPTTLGERLVSAREALGLTTAQLARRMGIKTATLSSWETDRTEPRANRLATLAAMTNVSIIWLLSAEGDGPSNQTMSGDLLELRNRLAALQTQADELTMQITAIVDHIDQMTVRVPEDEKT